MNHRSRLLAVCVALALPLLFATGCRAVPTPPHPSPAPTHAAAPPSRPSPAIGAAAAAATASALPLSPQARAQALAKRIIIVDGHIDLPYRLRKSRRPDGSISEDVTRRTPVGDFDWVRATQGGLDAPFMSIYVPAHHQHTGDAKQVADQLIDMVESLVLQAPDKFALARSAEDVRRNFAAGKVSLPMGIENGAALAGDKRNVAYFYNRGVRYLTLTHSKDNRICDSSYDTAHTHQGLSAFGREVVHEMNRVGMMIDVSHISDASFHQVMALSEAPVIASHSSCRHFTPGFERNMSDAMIEKLAAKGGVIMINFGSTFLDHQVRMDHKRVNAARDVFMKRHGLPKKHARVVAFKKKQLAALAHPFSDVARVVDHIDHVVALVGIDHVGLGSDFDGVGDSLPRGLKDPSELPNLLRELLARGYSEADIEKIASANVLRVWQQVQAQAAR